MFVPVDRACDRCGTFFTARSPRARYCCDSCRSAANHQRRKGRPITTPGRALMLVADSPSDPREDTAGNDAVLPITPAVRAELTAADAEDTALGAIAIRLAQIIDAVEGASGAGIAALVRELRAVLAEALRAATPVAENPLLTLRRRRSADRDKGTRP